MNNLKSSKYLSDCITSANHEDLALLWLDITRKKVVCIDCKNFVFYQFNKKTLLYEIIEINQFTEIVKLELRNYLKEVASLNTDKRLQDLIKNMGCRTYTKNVSETIAVKIYDKTFMNKLDVNKDKINLSNGVINLRTGDFLPRTKKDLYSKCLNYEFDEDENIVIKDKIKKLLLNICNDDNEFLEFMLSWLGYCLTGETKEQKSMWLIGHSAGNGKSTISKIFQNCFSPYCFKLDSKALNEGFGKLHKQLANCKGVRYVYMEELDQNKLDTSLYKDLVARW